jgi:hypothetical protein
VLGKGSEDERANNLTAVLDGYFAQGGHHINVNVLNRCVCGCVVCWHDMVMLVVVNMPESGLFMMHVRRHQAAVQLLLLLPLAHQGVVVQ